MLKRRRTLLGNCISMFFRIKCFPIEFVPGSLLAEADRSLMAAKIDPAAIVLDRTYCLDQF